MQIIIITPKEIAIWKAVILQAFIDISSHSKKKIAKTYRNQAIKWFSLQNPDFLEVCSYAEINPNYVYKKAKIIIEKNNMINLLLSKRTA